jgi:hypothetical protein
VSARLVFSPVMVFDRRLRGIRRRVVKQIRSEAYEQHPLPPGGCFPFVVHIGAAVVWLVVCGLLVRQFRLSGWIVVPGLLLGWFLIALNYERFILIRGSALFFQTPLSAGLCPGCAYNLRKLPEDSDRCVVCPECGCAWKRDRVDTRKAL